MTAESDAMTLKVTQDIDAAMKPVEALAARAHGDNGYDPEHTTLAQGICILKSVDAITCARVSDVKDTVDRIETSVKSSNGHVAVFKRGPLKGVPVKYVFYLSVVVAVLSAGIIMFAMTHGKLNELATAVSIATGKAEKEGEIKVANDTTSP